MTDVKYVPDSQADRDKRLVRQGDVIFNNTNSPELVGKTAHYDLPEPRAFSNHMTRLRCRSDVLDPRFCAMVLHHKWREGYFTLVCNNHVSQSSVSRTVLLEMPIRLPPLSEQTRIVAGVEELRTRVNAARERLRRVPVILKRFRQAVLAAACSGRLTADWREEHPDACSVPTLTAVERFEPDFGLRSKFDLPPKWSFMALGSLGEWAGGGTPSKSVPAYWKGGTIPWVTPKDMKADVIADSQDHITNAGAQASRLRVFPPGVVLFVVRGLILARDFPVAMAGCSATVNQDLRVVAPWAGVEPAYIRCALQADRPYVLAAVREATHGTLRLESPTLKCWPVPIPPVEEQHEIVRRVETLFGLADAIERRVAAAAARADRLTHSILAKAFRGELVPTEAELARLEGRDYEPASALLERIRAEREITADSRRGRR